MNRKQKLQKVSKIPIKIFWIVGGIGAWNFEIRPFLIINSWDYGNLYPKTQN